MRHILLLLICFTLASFQTSRVDKYRIIKVTGGITVKKSGDMINQGDVINSDEELLFRPIESRAMVISSVKGRFILSSVDNNGSTVSSNLLPAMNNLSSRAGALLNMIDLKNHFDGNYVILNRIEIQVSSESFPMNEENFFYLRYEYKGEHINKRLAYNEDKIIIDKQDLFTVDGKPIPNPEIKVMDLYYFKNNTSNFISEFNPVFPDNEELKIEVEIILNELTDKPTDFKINEITAYMNEIYGKPNKDNLKEWLAENFNL